MRPTVRLLSTALSFLILVTAWMSPYCRTSEGALNTLFAGALAAAAAIAVAGWTASTIWASAGRWLALALAGQAAALQLIDAGVRIHYQHLRLPAETLADPVLRWMLVTVGLQSLLVIGGLFRQRHTIRTWLEKPYRLVLLVGAIAACGCVAAAVSRDPRYYAVEVSLGALIELVNACNILLAVWHLPASGLERLGRRFDSLLGDRNFAGPLKIDRFALLAALWATVVSALLAWCVYQRHPHVADEVSYLFHARYFAEGKLAAPPPPLVSAFQIDLTEYKPDKWYAVPPMGWAAVLAVGTALGVPWLVNPVLAGLNILLSYLLLGEFYSRRLARIAVLLLCLSPWYIFMAMSYMNHMLTMTCMLLAFLGIAWARRTGHVRWAWMAGAGVGATSLIRPLEGLIVGLLTAAWAIGLGGKRLRFPALAALAAATVITGAITLPYNKMLIGDAIKSPIMQYNDDHYGHNSNAYGFGPDRGMGWATDAYPGHTPFEALINAELNGSSLNVELFGWSTGSLVLMAVLIFFGKLSRADFLMLAAILVVMLAYMPYWGNGGGDFGARYWYVMLLPCTALTARGLERLETGLGTQGRNDIRATAAAAALCLLALVNYFPWRSLDKYYHYLRMSSDVRSLARVHDFGRSLVLVRGERFPDYASAAIYNPIDLNADAPVYAWDRSPSVRSELLRLYADRPVWILEGPSLTQAGYRIVAGPLSAGTRP
jgi:hypothetical protein